MYEYDGPTLCGKFSDKGYRDLVERYCHELIHHNPYDVRSFIQTTKLEYYGFFDPLPTPDDPGAGVRLSKRQKSSFGQYRKVWAQEQKEVEAANRLAWTKDFEANAEKIWRRKFAFKPYNEVSECNGCGWSKE